MINSFDIFDESVIDLKSVLNGFKSIEIKFNSRLYSKILLKSQFYVVSSNSSLPYSKSVVWICKVCPGKASAPIISDA